MGMLHIHDESLVSEWKLFVMGEVTKVINARWSCYFSHFLIAQVAPHYYSAEITITRKPDIAIYDKVETGSLLINR